MSIKIVSDITMLFGNLNRGSVFKFIDDEDYYMKVEINGKDVRTNCVSLLYGTGTIAEDCSEVIPCKIDAKVRISKEG